MTLMPVPIAINNQKVMFHLISIVFIKGMTQCSFGAIDSCSANISASAEPHFNYFD